MRARHALLREQDAARADARCAGLLSRLKKARGQLGANPAMGRPARFADAGTPRSRALLAEVMALAHAQGLPQLRELVMAPYLLLYAHGDRRVMLLSLRHSLQLAYTLRRGEARLKTAAPPRPADTHALHCAAPRWPRSG